MGDCDRFLHSSNIVPVCEFLKPHGHELGKVSDLVEERLTYGTLPALFSYFPVACYDMRPCPVQHLGILHHLPNTRKTRNLAVTGGKRLTSKVLTIRGKVSKSQRRVEQDDKRLKLQVKSHSCCEKAYIPTCVQKERYRRKNLHIDHRTIDER